MRLRFNHKRVKKGQHCTDGHVGRHVMHYANYDVEIIILTADVLRERDNVLSI